MKSEVKTRTRRKAERPAEILQAAFEEFVERGYAAARLEDVAARAGVTKGTVYFYFDSKEHVFDEMVRHVSRSFFPEIESYAEGLEGSYTARLKSLIGFSYNRIAEDRASREILRFLIAEGSRFPDLVDRHYEEFVRPLIEQFRKLIDGGIAAGDFRATRGVGFTEIIVSPALLLALWALLFGSRKKIDTAVFIDASVDLLMNGLAAPR